MNESDTDVVIVGGGLAGLTAGGRLARGGHRVTVVEAGADGHYLCNSRIASGSYQLAHSDPTLDAATLRDAIMGDTEDAADPDLAAAVAAIAGEAMQWLRSEGTKFIKVSHGGKGASWSMAPPRPATPSFGWEGRGPDLTLRALTKNFKAHGGQLALGTRAERLLIENGHCIGIAATQEGRTITIRARSTVLADGGFQGNPELVRRFISKRPESLVQRNAKTGRGDALRMAEEGGAMLTGTDRFYGHLLVQEALKNDGLWPYPTIDSLASSAVVVDSSGRRFLDEGIGGVTMSNVIAKLDDPLSATTIFDNTLWETTGRVEFTPPNPFVVAGGGTLTTAPTLEALAQAINIPAAALVETIRSYNELVESGNFAALSPPRSPGRMFGVLRSSNTRTEIRPIKDPPFHAIRLCAGLTYTMGGIAISPRTEVRRADGSAIAGLYAIGACTGGLEGGPMAGYIGGLCKAASLGFIASEEIGARLWAHR
jgi:fumarate reductase flavoprotein subunit